MLYLRMEIGRMDIVEGKETGELNVLIQGKLE